MKKTIFAFAILSTFSALSEEGLVTQFMKEQNDALTLPSAQDLASTAAIIAGTTVVGVAGHSSVARTQPQIRALIPNPGIPVISSPYFWFVLGGVATAFGIYHFIGREMAIIIETKSTLQGLEKQIKLWEKELPLLKENQENLGAKVKDAIGILDTITPLVVKLAKNSETVGTAQQVVAIKKELADLKDLVNALVCAQGTSVSQAVTQKSHSLFGFGKK